MCFSSPDHDLDPTPNDDHSYMDLLGHHHHQHHTAHRSTRVQIPPKGTLAEKFNTRQDAQHGVISLAAASVFRLVGMGRSFDRIRNRHRLRRADRELRPKFDEMERESLKRVARLVREGVITVPADLEMVALTGHGGKERWKKEREVVKSVVDRILAYGRGEGAQAAERGSWEGVS